MAFRHGQQQVENPAGHQPEVAGIGGDIDIGEPVDQAVEAGRGRALKKAFAVTLAALAVNHIGILIHQRHHVGQQLRRILQIGIDDQDALAAADRQPGGERELVAVVAHQADRHDPRVGGGGGRHDLPGPVARAVVDQHDFAGAAPCGTQGVQDGTDPAQEFGQDVLLVETGSHHGYRRAGGFAHGRDQ